MFGYVRVQLPELRVREYRYYRGVYCGLCRAQGRCTGQCSRMTLSYDYVFLSLLRMALQNGNPTKDAGSAVRFERRRCLPHPFRRRLSLTPGEATDHVALCAAMLNYHKICDDRADERRFSRAGLRAFFLAMPLRHIYRRARRRAPALASGLSEAMAAFSAVEKAREPSADAPAAAFGQVTALLLSYGLDGQRKTVAQHVGMHVGKWLYFADAVDDFDEDVRRDRYNPLRLLYGDAPLTQEKRAAIATAMGHELMQADDALALLDYDDESCGRELRALLTHMLHLALPSVTRQLADGTYGKPSKNNDDQETVPATEPDARGSDRKDV